MYQQKLQNKDANLGNARSNLRAALMLCERLHLVGRPYDEASFAQLSDTEKGITLEAMDTWSKVISSYVKKGGNVKKSKDLIRYYLMSLGFRAPTEFIDSIQDGDIVEIYDSEGKRIFFNPDLFDYSSYAADEMFSSQWWNLYSKDQDVANTINKFAFNIFIGNITSAINPGIPKHVVSESKSELKYSAEIEIKLLSPIYFGPQIVGAAALERFKLL
ncbi:MAG: hypothetical protein ACXVCY_04250 [Pseudobdellovibrionaceae bacterium]